MHAPQPIDAPRPTRTTWAVALTVAGAGFLVWQFVPVSGALLDPTAEPRAIAPRGDLTPQEKQVTTLFQTASPSVVFIREVEVADPQPVDPEGRQMRLDPTVVVDGTGSGFLWDGTGHVVTNYHVIHSAIQQGHELLVNLANHESFPAQVVGFEAEKDIAVLKIGAPADILPPIAIGSSSDLVVGQSVYAIGNPFGLDQTLTHGLISGLDREMRAKFEEDGRGRHWITGLIQTDAAINPGNSGGPLLDSSGRLIGMNTAIRSEKGESNGLGFAIPVDTINRIVTDILRYGQARRPGLGVRIFSMGSAGRGVVIGEVQPGSGAERAGLKSAVLKRRGNAVVGIVAADVIVKANGKDVRTTEDLFREIDRLQAGDKVKLQVDRDGKALDVEVELQYLQSQ